MAKILVVDDTEDITQIIRQLLEDEGHEVVATNSPAEAQKLLENGNYQILVTDILMPGNINGYGLIEQACRISNDNGKRPRIIAISGGIKGLGADTILDAVSLKADIVIRKPFRKEEMTAAVRSLIAV